MGFWSGLVSAVITIGATVVGGLIGGPAGAAIGSMVGGLASSALVGVEAPDKTDAALPASLASETRLTRDTAPVAELVYGEVVKSGSIHAYLKSGNRQHHFVIIFADHEIAAFDRYWIGDVELPELDASGDVLTGRFSGNVNIKTYLGTADQAADANLVARVPEWTAAHRLRGRAYVVLTLKSSARSFPRGFENFKAQVRGGLVYDPRTTATVYSTNPALVLRDYWSRADGFGVDNLAFASVLDANTILAADTSDESVALVHELVEFTADTSDERLTLADESVEFETCDGVTVSSTGTPPAGLAASTTYYVVRLDRGVVQLATSLANARARTVIDITDAGTGAHTLTRESQLRYTFNGTARLDRAPQSIADDILQSMAGAWDYTQGTLRMHAGAAVSSSQAIDQDVLRADVEWIRSAPRDELFNKLSGLYVDRETGQAREFPALVNVAYAAQDGGEVINRDVEFRFVRDPTRAQRIGLIHMKKSRHGHGVLRCMWHVLERGVWDTITLDFPYWGWSAVELQIVGYRQATDGGGIDLEVVGYGGAADYLWAATDAVAVAPAALPSPGDAGTVAAPGAPVVVEATYETRGGGGVKAKATLTAAASADGLLAAYRFRHQLTAADPDDDLAWTYLPASEQPIGEVLDIAPGTFRFEAAAFNIFGHVSAWQRTVIDIQGLAGPPVAVAGLTMAAVSSLAVLRWDLHADADVRKGGEIRFRHSNAQSGATWQASVSIGQAVGGAETVALLPLKPGTYLARPFDALGVPGPVSSVSTKAGTVQAFTSLGSVTEEALYLGTHAGTVVVAGALKLGGAGLFDDIPDLDLVVDLDVYGGILSTGTYTFASGIDLGSIKRARLESTVAALIVNVLADMDDRTALMDDWEDFDGALASGADCQVWFRETDDDPAGSPITWSAWERLDVAEANARGFEFQARLSSDDPAYNVLVTTLQAKVEEI